jgi:methionine-rich copper-binding protein CopC
MIMERQSQRRGAARARGSGWLAAVAALLVFAVPLFAHGALRRSTPAEGAHLQAVPRELRMTFTEAVELPFARVTLTGPAGSVGLGPPSLSPDSATVLIVPVTGPMVAGMYRIAWQVAGEDGHPVRGQIAFMVRPDADGIASSQAAGPPAGQQPADHDAGMEHGSPDHHDPQTFGGAGFNAESPLYVAIRWVTFLGLLGAIGAVAFRLVLWAVGRQRYPFEAAFLPVAARRAARIGLILTGGVAVAALLRLFAQARALDVGVGALMGTLSNTTWGWGWILQVLGVALAAVGFWFAARGGQVGEAPSVAVSEPVTVTPPVSLSTDAVPEERSAAPPAAEGVTATIGLVGPKLYPAEPSPAAQDAQRTEPAPATMQRPAAPSSGTAPWWLAGLGAALLAATPAMSGHAASTPWLAPLPILTDTVHVIGAGGWLGSLLLLLVVGIPVALRLAQPDRGPAVAALVNAFSPTALFFAGTAAATGVFAAWLHLGTVPALWESTYGRTLLLKLAVLSIVFGTGAYNWLKVKPALGEEAAAGRLRKSATLELAVGVVVVLVTAVLVATSPPTDAEMTMRVDAPRGSQR